MRIVVAFLAACAALSQLEAAVLLRDLVYGEAAGESLKLDICTPDGPGPFPVVVLVHGGGWMSGDKAGAEKPGSGADITPWFQPLTDAGIAWVSVNYRLAPAHRWPACLEDVRTSVAWVRSHAAEYRCDPARIALMGHSAGGHLALLAAAPAADGSRPVSAVVGCAAVSDLVSDTRRRGGPSASLQALFNLDVQPGEGWEQRLGAASPVSLVERGYPPALLLHGEADKTVPLAQSSAFQARLAELGTRCDLHVLPATGHRLTEWTAKDPRWRTVLTEWLRARWAEPTATSKP